MPLLANNQYILCTINGTLLGQRVINTYQYRVAGIGGGVQIDMVAGLNALRERLNSAGKLFLTHKAMVPINFHCINTWLQIVYPQRFAKQVYNGYGDGTYGDSAETANVSGSITRRSIFANRHGVGGIRFPISPTDQSIEDGLLNAALLNKAADHAIQMGASQTIAVGADTFVVYPVTSQFLNVNDHHDVAQTFVQDTVRVARRRTLRLGE